MRYLKFSTDFSLEKGWNLSGMQELWIFSFMEKMVRTLLLLSSKQSDTQTNLTYYQMKLSTSAFSNVSQILFEVWGKLLIYELFNFKETQNCYLPELFFFPSTLGVCLGCTYLGCSAPRMCGLRLREGRCTGFLVELRKDPPRNGLMA